MSLLTHICRPCGSFRNYLRVLLPKTCGGSQLRTVTHEVNLAVAQDVLLFRNDNSKYYRLLNLFGICQFGFWTYLTYALFTSLRDVPPPPDSDLPWWRKINLGEKKYRYGLSALSLFLGCGVFFSSTVYSMRSIKYLVLNKGGKSITFATHGLFAEGSPITVSLNKVSCEQSRHSSRVQIPLKVEGRKMFYVLDMRGQFLNATLFDRTAGLKRKISGW